MMIDAMNSTQMAMQLDQLKLQSITQNVANMNTPGFKKQSVEHHDFEAALELPSQNNALAHLERMHITSQGTFNQTKNPQDLAISGEGYFQVQGEDGVYYTRRGDFQINNKGELCTATGETLMGSGGVIQVNDEAFTIDAQGALFIDHHKVDQLNIMTFSAPQDLEYIGTGLYKSLESPTPASSSTRVLQGFIEQSNVKSIDEMMDMISTSRHFEASQRVMRTANNLLSTAINQLGEGNV